jgi:cobalt/nickel transport system permease protein
MHIPDGFLDAKTLVATGVLAATGVAIALREAQKHLPPRRIPLLGLTAAFVFAAQMVNFPVAGGTSGHLIGGTLAAVLLGPSGAVLVITAVLIVQCLIFADGGLLALGANVFNMAIVSGVGSFYIYRAVYRLLGGNRGQMVAVVVAAWCGTVMAAIVAAGELSLSGVVPWRIGLVAMAGVHMLIGVGEALITMLVLLAIRRARPEILREGALVGNMRAATEMVAFGLLIALGLAMFVAPFASAWPDGLEKVAARLGFQTRALAKPLVPSPMADYAVPRISSATWATAVAGGLGTGLVFLLALGVTWLLVVKKRQRGRPVSRSREVL